MEIDSQLVFQVLRKEGKKWRVKLAHPALQNCNIPVFDDGASVAAVLLLVFTEGFDKRNTFSKKCESCTQVYHCLYSHHLMVASIPITHRSGG